MRHGPMKCHTMYVMILSRSLAMPNFVFVDTDALDSAAQHLPGTLCGLFVNYVIRSFFLSDAGGKTAFYNIIL